MKKILSISLVLIFISALLYFWLGGGSEVQFEMISSPKYPITASYYEGVYNSSELEEIFGKYQTLAKESNSALVILNLGSNQYAAKVYQWVGILGADSSLFSTQNRILQLESKKGLISRFEVHSSVLPPPEKVAAIAAAKADSLGFQLQQKSLEIYYPDEHVEIVYFSKED